MQLLTSIKESLISVVERCHVNFQLLWLLLLDRLRKTPEVAALDFLAKPLGEHGWAFSLVFLSIRVEAIFYFVRKANPANRYDFGLCPGSQSRART